MRQQARVALPELPAERAERYAADWELPEDTARLFAFEPDWGDFFEEAATAAAPLEARPVANLVTELRSRLRRRRSGLLASSRRRRSPRSPASSRSARRRPATPARCSTCSSQEGGDPAAIVEREGLGAMEDDGELAGIVAQVLADNPDVVERVKGGNEKAIGALVGPIMKATRGRADGGEVNRQIRQQLGI